jgi:hypothetical protein
MAQFPPPSQARGVYAIEYSIYLSPPRINLIVYHILFSFRQGFPILIKASKFSPQIQINEVRDESRKS